MVLSDAPQIIITNFDVLHYHLWHRTRFSYLLRTTQFLVIDEAHTYTGVFGANVHYIVKRLERLCKNKLQIIAASATLPNAGQFCKTLLGRELEVIQGEGRKGKINFVMLFPSLQSHRSLVLDLVKRTTGGGHKTIAFSNSHLGSELLSFYLSRQGIKIKVHRAGLLPSVRKEVEQSFKEENAIYFLSGKRYQVKKLHYDVNEEANQPYYAELISIPTDYPYYTRAMVGEWPNVIQIYERKKVLGVDVKYCSLKIRKKITGYTNIEIGQEVTQGTKVMFSKPIEFEFITKGFVFRAPKPLDTLKDANDEDYVEMSGYHASEHVLIEGSTMLTGGTSQDMGGVSLGSSGMIFIHDGSIGGNGASKALYDRFEAAIRRALRILMECPCKSDSGCPRCTYSYRCGNNNEYLHKNAAIEILDRAVSGKQTEIDLDIQVDRSLV